MAYTLGIDLGTTYSAAAVGRDGHVEVFGLGTTAPVIPSVVLLREDDTVLTGEAADRRSNQEPTRTAREFKRRLGDPVPIVLGGTPYGPEALMAHLLRAIVDAVTGREGERPALVVLTHPANYSDYKKSLLEESARLAGLDLSDVRFITEPEAAAASYARQERVEPGELVAVYDLGGGTFDAAVVRKTTDGFEPIGRPEGMERLGGVDIDQAVLAHIDRSLDGMVAQLDVDDPAIRSALARLRDDARLAKEALSADADTTVVIALPGLSTEVRLTREELESMIRPRVSETVDALERAVRSADVDMSEVSRVLLIGGSSRIPLVAQVVRERTGRPVVVDAHPKLAVATGAATAFTHEQMGAGVEPGEPPAATGGASGVAVIGGAAGAGIGAGAALGAAAGEGAAEAADLPGAAAGTAGTTRGAPGTTRGAPGTTRDAPADEPVQAGGQRATSKVRWIIGAAVAVGAAVGTFFVMRALTSEDSPTQPESAGAPAASVPPSASTPSAASSASSASTAEVAGPVGRGLDAIVTTVAGNGTDSGSGVPGPALAASLGTPADVAVAPDGTVYVVDRAKNRLLQVQDGQVSEAYVGNTAAGEAGFGGVAVSPSGTVVFSSGRGIAQLDGPNTATLLLDRRQYPLDGESSLAFGPGGELYGGFAGDHQLYRLDGGEPVAVAGSGVAAAASKGAATGDGGPATAATFAQISDIAVGADGTIYVVDSADGRVRAFQPGGTISTVAGGGTMGLATAEPPPDGTPAQELQLDEPVGVAVTASGMVYVSDQNSHVIFRVDEEGAYEVVIASVGGVQKENGKPANQTQLYSPGDLVVSGDDLYFLDGTDLRTLAGG